MNPDGTIRVAGPDERQTKKLTPEQILSLVGGVRGVIQRETYSAEEAAGISIAVLATFLMDISTDDVEVVAKELAKIRNKVVNQFRTGELRMNRTPNG